MKAQKKIEKSEYDLQAEKFLQDTGTTIESIYTGHRLYFDGDKEHRATFKVTIKRGDKEMSFDYGNSIVNSWCLMTVNMLLTTYDKKLGLSDRHELKPLPQVASRFKSVNEATKAGKEIKDGSFTVVKRKTPPSDYDILTSIEKNDPETFDFFCDTFGYSNDSIKARDIYFKCQKQFSDLQRLFTNKELEALQEIQ